MNQSYSSVVYLGHNVFETHKTFDFLNHPIDRQSQPCIRPSTADRARSDGYSKSLFESHFDQATRHVKDSDIMRWATAIPDHLPLTLSALAMILPGPGDRVPPTTEYPLMASLAIFQCPERRLTDEGVLDALVENLSWFRIHSEDDVWKVRIGIVSIVISLTSIIFSLAS